MRFSATFFTVAAFGLVLAWGCGNDDPAGPDLATVSFSPTVDMLDLHLDEIVDLGVEVSGSGADWTVVFRRGLTVLSHDREYTYVAQTLGPDSLEAVVTFPDRTVSWKWHMNVSLGSALPPPIVHVFTAIHGEVPGSVLLQWYKPASSLTPRPIRGYQLRVSYGAELIAENWDDAEVLDFVDSVDGLQTYHEFYISESNAAIHEGERAWFGIVTEDVAGLESPLGTVDRLDITYPYEISGNVFNDEGVALEDALVIFDAECDSCKTVTASDGSFSLGPFRNFDRFALTVKYDGEGPDAVGDCYGVRTDSVGIDNSTGVDVFLVKMRSLNAGCDINGYENEFLNLLKHVTMTGPYNPSLVFSNDDVLRKWEEYPIPIYIPEGVNLAGNLNLGEMVRWCVDEWNTEMGEAYFVEVPSREQADIEVAFGVIGPLGQLAVVRPIGGVMNEVIPELATLTINVELNLYEFTTEVIMHELGHALCMGVHSICITGDQQAFHLIASPPANIIQLRGWDNIVSADEEAVVRAIRNLPQGMHMDSYFSD